MPTRVFIAGASGVIGVRLIPLLVQAGCVVTGMTRTPAKAELLEQLGAVPVVCDVYDRATLTVSVAAARPDVVVHQLTDLPDRREELADRASANNRIRREGTANLLAAAGAANAAGFLAQSIAWDPPGDGAVAKREMERMVLELGGAVLRYGQFYGPGTYYEREPPEHPRIHVDAAARRTVAVLDRSQVTLTIDESVEQQR